MNSPASSQTPNVELPEVEVVLDSDAESDSKVNVLTIGMVSSNCYVR